MNKLLILTIILCGSILPLYADENPVIARKQTMDSIIVVYITNPSLEKAQELAKHLLAKKVIACANLLDAKSLYVWQGAPTQDNEVVLIAKTMPECVVKLEQEILAVHPYEVPCIVCIQAQANAEYARWVKASLSGA